MAESIEIHGICDDAYLPVKEAFQWGFDEGLEVGASVAIAHEGEMVVDLWGGFANRKETRPWQKDTMVLLASTTKIMTNLCALMVIDQGQLDPDAAVVEYWPEFGKHGKDEVLVRQMLEARKDSFPPDKAPRTHFTDFNAESLNLQVTYWFIPPEWGAYLDFNHAFNMELLERFNEEGIEFAFPTQTLYVKQDSALQADVRLSPPRASGKKG